MYKLESKYIIDVTLVHEEDQRFEAHKVVHTLNSASPEVSRKDVINQNKISKICKSLVKLSRTSISPEIRTHHQEQPKHKIPKIYIKHKTPKKKYKIQKYTKKITKHKINKTKEEERMATFEQIQALLARQEEKNIERLDQLEKDIEKNVKESLTEEVVKNVVKSLGPTIMDKVEKEVSKAVEPVMKQQEKTEAELNKIKEVLEKLSYKVNSQEMVKNKTESEAPAPQKGKAGGVWGGVQGGKGAESGVRETPEIEKKERGDIERWMRMSGKRSRLREWKKGRWRNVKQRKRHMTP